jgi:hypothetical protein
VSTLERALAVIRDVLLILVLTAVLVVGWSALSAIHRVVDRAPAVQPTPPLPADGCGGGIC